jgi:hypothetical protein
VDAPITTLSPEALAAIQDAENVGLRDGQRTLEEERYIAERLQDDRT